MSETVIRVENLSKKYALGRERERGYRTLRDVIAGKAKRLLRPLNGSTKAAAGNGEEFWALKDVCFEIKQGEVLGIIGRNGAGKSTLLKILSRITEPTAGRVRIKGRVSSLLEVGTGFHPELTGRENIFLNGAILGMTRAEIKRKFDCIVAFAEVDKFLDTPVKRYSSGMYVRLAFAVAAHLEPEVLIVDEVLAVGDAQFQKKCLGKMAEVGRAGRAVLFVSHNMGAIEALCKTAIHLERGEVVASGDVPDVIRAYLGGAESIRQCADLSQAERSQSGATTWFTEACVLSEANEPKTVFRVGEKLRIRLRLDGEERLPSPRIGIGVNDEMGRRIFTVGTEFDPNLELSVTGEQVVLCDIPELLLAPGRYQLTIALSSAHELIDQIEGLIGFDVTESDFFKTGKFQRRDQGFFLCRSSWSVL